MPKRLMVPEENRALLEAAGYEWHTDESYWQHATSRRQIVAEIAAALSAEQVAHWIAAGEGRKPEP
jgi:hypothetical protein